MEVKIINKNEAKNLFKSWGEFSKTCYDTKGVSPDVIGKHCFNSGHFSGSRANYIVFEIQGVARSIVDQLVRHEQGVVKNVQSTRYVDKFGFKIDVPEDIKDNEPLVRILRDEVDRIDWLYRLIQEHIMSKGKSKERANEQARTILPLGIHTNATIGFTVEALTHYMNVRLCTRAEKEHRELAKAMREEVLKILPELEDVLVPQCERLLYCPEAKSCGKSIIGKELIKLRGKEKNAR